GRNPAGRDMGDVIGMHDRGPAIAQQRLRRDARVVGQGAAGIGELAALIGRPDDHREGFRQALPALQTPGQFEFDLLLPADVLERTFDATDASAVVDDGTSGHPDPSAGPGAAGDPELILEAGPGAGTGLQLFLEALPVLLAVAGQDFFQRVVVLHGQAVQPEDLDGAGGGPGAGAVLPG